MRLVSTGLHSHDFVPSQLHDQAPRNSGFSLPMQHACLHEAQVCSGGLTCQLVGLTMSDGPRADTGACSIDSKALQCTGYLTAEQCICCLRTCFTQVNPVPPGDLSLIKSVTPKRRAKGGRFTYKITVAPRGRIEDAVVVDTLPDGVTNPIIISPKNKCTVVKSNVAGKRNMIKCDLGTLTAPVEIRYTAKAAEVGTHTNIVEATYDGQTDPKQAQATVVVWVSARILAGGCQ